MAARKEFARKAAEILVEELGRETALKILERIDNETSYCQSESVIATLDRLIAAVIQIKGGQKKK